MRNYFILITLLVSIGFTSCDDADTYQTLLEKERKLRTEYLKREGFTKQSNGVSYQTLKEPENTDAEKVKVGDKVKIYYTGYFLDGRVFDSNVLAGRFEPLIVWIISENNGQIIKNGQASGEVIKGWLPGLLQMKEGMQERIVIPSSMAYGTTSTSGIPSFTSLVFDLEVTEIIPSK